MIDENGTFVPGCRTRGEAVEPKVIGNNDMVRLPG